MNEDALSSDGPQSGSRRPEWFDEHAYKMLAASAIGLVALATVVYHFTEEWSWVDSLYFSVVAVTTVGFGDLSPTTDASKLFTVAYILIGITLIGTYLNVRFKIKGRQRALDSD